MMQPTRANLKDRQWNLAPRKALSDDGHKTGRLSADFVVSTLYSFYSLSDMSDSTITSEDKNTEKKSLKRTERRNDPCTQTTLDIQFQDLMQRDDSFTLLPDLSTNYPSDDLDAFQSILSDNTLTEDSVSQGQRFSLNYNQDSTLSSSYPSPTSPFPFDQICDSIPTSAWSEYPFPRSRSISTNSQELPALRPGTGKECAASSATSECRWLSPLHIAAKKGHSRIIRILLQCDVDCNEQDSEGLTPLTHAVIGGHDDVVRLLLARGANITSNNAINDQQQPSALHLAVLHRRENILKLLLGHHEERSVLVDGLDHLGRTPLHIAIDTGFEAAVLMLLRSGADPRYKARRP
ncbi:hypothetical protein F66182_959 [Fusarium sp. NRRL 66182]|nr:hypothetical protein F66182_959 [Fusarium sp. NRRL 66182]